MRTQSDHNKHTLPTTTNSTNVARSIAPSETSAKPMQLAALLKRTVRTLLDAVHQRTPSSSPSKRRTYLRLIRLPSPSLLALICIIFSLLVVIFVPVRLLHRHTHTQPSLTVAGYESADSLHSNAAISDAAGFRIILVVPPFTNLPVSANPAYNEPQLFDIDPAAQLYSSHALHLLVQSLVTAHYDNERVELQLTLVPEANQTAFDIRHRQCNNFKWSHGPKMLTNATSGGLFELGVAAWSPARGDSQKVLIVDASHALPFAPQFYRYLKSVRRRFADNSADVSGFALEPVLVRQQFSIMGKSTGYTNYKVDSNDIFMYQNLPLVAAFSPVNAEVWRHFQRWFAAHRSEWFLWPTVVGARDKKDQAWEKYSGTMRAHWTLWFSRFCAEYNIYNVYPQQQRPEPLPPVGRASTPVARYSFDGESVKAGSGVSAESLERIIELGRRQGGSVSLTIVNEAFLETAQSWICNVDVGGIRPPGVVWIATDDVAYEALRGVGRSETVRMREFRGGTAARGTKYGTPGYWRLMLERTMLIGEILERGIGVFAFETDQIWMRDPVPFVKRLVHSGDEVDVVGTLDTRHEIGGNFLYLNPTLATRRVWGEVCRRFKRAFEQNKMERRSSKQRAYMENDQSILTKLVLFDEGFKTRNAVVLRTLDTQLFVDGRWYDESGKYYTDERARSPTMINNNFVVGIEEKKKRAMARGHWFVREGKCDEQAVLKAIEENEARAHERPWQQKAEGVDVEAGLDAALEAMKRERGV